MECFVMPCCDSAALSLEIQKSLVEYGALFDLWYDGSEKLQAHEFTINVGFAAEQAVELPLVEISLQHKLLDDQSKISFKTTSR